MRGEFEDQTRQTACRVGQNEGMLRGKYSYILISTTAHPKKSPEQQGTQHVLRHGEVDTNTDRGDNINTSLCIKIQKGRTSTSLFILPRPSGGVEEDVDD